MELIMYFDGSDDRRRTKGVMVPMIFFSLQVLGLYLILRILHFGHDLTPLGYFILGVGVIYLYEKLIRVIQRQRGQRYKNNATVTLRL